MNFYKLKTLLIGVLKNPEEAIQPLEKLGFTYKAEYNIPMRFYFSRSEGVDTNLHVYEEGPSRN